MPAGAPSVLSPEIVIPSAPQSTGSLQSFIVAAVLGPESLPGRLLLRHWDESQLLPSRRLSVTLDFALWQVLASRRPAGLIRAMEDYVFGYGSLVNRKTHDYAKSQPARIDGWRRTWRHVVGRDVAFLTAVPDAGSSIDGLIARVPGHAWNALDQREHSYDRALARDIAHSLDDEARVHIYHAPPERHVPATGLHPVLLSYVDVVVQGYLKEFGATGVQRFFETTDGWDAPVLDDRAAPIYPRHQQLSHDELALSDYWLSEMGATRHTRL